MILHHSLASSSAGNCSILSFDSGVTYLMIDCGIPIKEIKKKMFRLGIMIHQLKGVVVTHFHNDHIKSAKDLSLYCPIYMTPRTYLTYDKNFDNLELIEANKPFKINKTTIMPFSVKHVEGSVNFLIKNNVGEYILAITDTGSLDFNLKGIRPTYIIIEANYDEKVAEQMIMKREQEKFEAEQAGEEYEGTFLDYWMQRNISQDVGHLGVFKTIEILKNQINLSLCKRISLCHVSTTNGALDFHKRVYDALEGKIPVIQLHHSKVETIEIKREGDY